MHRILIGLVFIAAAVACSAEDNTILSQPKIVGADTKLDKRIAAAVVYLSKGREFCSGTLLSKRIVLTAAHCFPESAHLQNGGSEAGLSAVRKKFLAEAEIRTGVEAEVNPQAVLKIKDYRMQNGFLDLIRLRNRHAENPNSLNSAERARIQELEMQRHWNDIALIQLASDAPATAGFATLATARLKKGAVVVQAGYGLTAEKEGTTGVLFQLTSALRDVWAASGEYLVTGSQEKAICRGDSGGPMFVKPQAEGPLVVAGVISRLYKNHCRSHGVMTDVVAEKGFIERAMKELRE